MKKRKSRLTVASPLTGEENHPKKKKKAPSDRHSYCSFDSLREQRKSHGTAPRTHSGRGEGKAAMGWWVFCPSWSKKKEEKKGTLEPSASFLICLMVGHFSTQQKKKALAAQQADMTSFDDDVGLCMKEKKKKKVPFSRNSTALSTA